MADQPQKSTAKPSNGLNKSDPTLVQAWRLARALAMDGLRFWRHSFTRDARTREQRRARMAMDLHFLEYGAALRHVSPGHGRDRAERLASDLEYYVACWGHDAQTEIATRVLDAYAHRNADFPELVALAARAAGLHPPQTGLRGGAEPVTRADILSVTAPVDFLAFAMARHSIRQYASHPVPAEAIRRAVQIAQQSPSSCNRQTCRIHVWTDRQMIARIAALQSGNRGFGHELGGIAVLWTDLNDWTEAGERSNGLVDGGMFAMSFLYGLHAEGLGAVPLNWAEEPDQDRVLRRLAGLPDSAQVIVLVGFGVLPDNLSVPVSQRRPLAECMTLNPPMTQI